METQSTSKPISQGTCAFCKAELAKNKITQHLKFCKKRLATFAPQEGQSQVTKTRLFHILAEGRYNPQYWLHFELPASESLWWVDRFLKNMWIDDLDHLSGFTINGTNYSTEYPSDFFFSEKEVVEEKVDISEEEEKKALREVVDEAVSKFAEAFASSLGVPFSSDPQTTELVAEIKKPRSVYELINFLKAERVRITKEDRSAWKSVKSTLSKEERMKLLILQCQKWIVEEVLNEIEDCSMDVSLEHILKVGQKFSYIYDYGSSTYINLRVIGEREGIVQEQDDTVQLLAQNTASAFHCTVCGKPATRVPIDCHAANVADDAFCDECANKQGGYEGGTLPIINSPRVGVL
jgi:hypothetical protein